MSIPIRRTRSARQDRRTPLRWAAIAASLTGLAAGVHLSNPPPALALSGLQRTIGLSGGGTDPVKTASARCRDGKWVIGGGAFVDDGGRNRVRLTQLRPIHDPGGSDRFVAGATAPNLGTSFEWTLAVFTVCADRRALSGYDIVIDSSERSFASKKSALARCPSGTVAYGTGAETLGAAGHVGLQLNRTSGPLDISRAFARDDASPVAAWNVLSYAVCAEPAGGIRSVAQGTPGPDGSVACPPRSFVHGPGGGGGLVENGLVWLNKIVPSGDLQTVSVSMTGPPLPSAGMVAWATCGA